MNDFEQLLAQLDSIGRIAVRFKNDRDCLETVCQAVYDALNDMYDVDEPVPGQRRELPFRGAGDLLYLLKMALTKVRR